MSVMGKVVCYFRRHWWVPTLAAAFVAWVLWSSVSLVAASHQRDRVVADNQRFVCESINERALAPLRGILEQAQTATTRNPLPPGLTVEQRDFYEQQRARADDYYRGWLALTAPIDCEALRE